MDHGDVLGMFGQKNRLQIKRVHFCFLIYWTTILAVIFGCIAQK